MEGNIKLLRAEDKSRRRKCRCTCLPAGDARLSQGRKKGESTKVKRRRIHEPSLSSNKRITCGLGGLASWDGEKITVAGRETEGGSSSNSWGRWNSKWKRPAFAEGEDGSECLLSGSSGRAGPRTESENRSTPISLKEYPYLRKEGKGSSKEGKGLQDEMNGAKEPLPAWDWKKKGAYGFRQ